MLSLPQNSIGTICIGCPADTSGNTMNVNGYMPQLTDFILMVEGALVPLDSGGSVSLVQAYDPQTVVLGPGLTDAGQGGQDIGGSYSWNNTDQAFEISLGAATYYIWLAASGPQWMISDANQDSTNSAAGPEINTAEVYPLSGALGDYGQGGYAVQGNFSGDAQLSGPTSAVAWTFTANDTAALGLMQVLCSNTSYVMPPCNLQIAVQKGPAF
jgi:hypothetical protein